MILPVALAYPRLAKGTMREAHRPTPRDIPSQLPNGCHNARSTSATCHLQPGPNKKNKKIDKKSRVQQRNIKTFAIRNPSTAHRRALQASPDRTQPGFPCANTQEKRLRELGHARVWSTATCYPAMFCEYANMPRGMTSTHS